MTEENSQTEEWFLGRDCQSCGEFIPMFPEHDRPVHFGSIGLMEIECPHCHQTHQYGTLQMKRRRVSAADRP